MAYASTQCVAIAVAGDEAMATRKDEPPLFCRVQLGNQDPDVNRRCLFRAHTLTALYCPRESNRTAVIETLSLSHRRARLSQDDIPNAEDRLHLVARDVFLSNAAPHDPEVLGTDANNGQHVGACLAVHTWENSDENLILHDRIDELSQHGIDPFLAMISHVASICKKTTLVVTKQIDIAERYPQVAYVEDRRLFGDKLRQGKKSFTMHIEPYSISPGSSRAMWSEHQAS